MKMRRITGKLLVFGLLCSPFMLACGTHPDPPGQSMDGRGRALVNVFIERFWWTLKYEEVYPKDYADGRSLYHGLGNYFDYYNHERKHSALDKRTPGEVFLGGSVRI